MQESLNYCQRTYGRTFECITMEICMEGVAHQSQNARVAVALLSTKEQTRHSLRARGSTQCGNERR